MNIERVDPAKSLEELIALAAVEYGDAEISNKDYLRWQYLCNPAGNALVVVARADSGELAGQYVVVPMEFKVDNEIVRGSLSLNTLTHPEYRGQGLFTQMAKKTYEICERSGFLMTLGFPNKNSYPGFVRKLQFSHIGNAKVMFRPLSVGRLLGSLPHVRQSAKYAPSVLEGLKTAQFHDASSRFDFGELEFRADASDYDKFINGQRTNDISVFKSAEFCDWRFRQIPTRAYSAFQARQGGEIKATCVIRQRLVKGIECVFVMDLQAADGQIGFDASKELIHRVLKSYKKSGVALAGIMVSPGSSASKIARSLRFNKMPRQLLPHDAPIIVRRNGQTLHEEILEINLWNLFFGDYDVF